MKIAVTALNKELVNNLGIVDYEPIIIELAAASEDFTKVEIQGEVQDTALISTPKFLKICANHYHLFSSNKGLALFVDHALNNFSVKELEITTV